MPENPDGNRNKKQLLGSRGEKLACKFLKKNGYKILERNYRSRYGEIDIIAKDSDFIVFVEVKARRSVRFGSPKEAVNQRKQYKISIVALDYLKKHKIIEQKSRFDVVSIKTSGNKSEIEIIKNAFELSYR
ncbi:MAG: YraN family protein [Desulfobacterales bacterium]|nr:YraN family protein [Desulfobacterales bacterium]MCP4160286.1 YraN family protein [Deltaproteobacteria bacterium]